MYDEFKQRYSTVHTDFKTIDSTPEVCENTKFDVYTGILVDSDPSGVFDEFSFTSDGSVDSRGAIIVKVNQNQVHTNKQFQTLLDMYTDNDIILISYINSEGESSEISVKIKEDGFKEVNEEERKYFGRDSSEVDFEVDQNEGFTQKQRFLRYIVFFLFILFLLFVLSGAIVQIVSIVIDITEVNDLISILT